MNCLCLPWISLSPGSDQFGACATRNGCPRAPRGSSEGRKNVFILVCMTARSAEVRGILEVGLGHVLQDETGRIDGVRWAMAVIAARNNETGHAATDSCKIKTSIPGRNPRLKHPRYGKGSELLSICEMPHILVINPLAERMAGIDRSTKSCSVSPRSASSHERAGSCEPHDVQ